VSRGRLESNPLRILDTKNEKERQLLSDAPILIDFIDDESRAHYEAVKVHLTAIGIAFEEDPFLVRGLDYYSRTSFEFESDVLGAQGALAGGGRYDLLSTEVGSKKVVPAVGFAAGMERLLMTMHEAGLAALEESRLDVFMVGLGDAAADWIFPTAHRLRALGLTVGYDLKGRSMKAQMREANRRNARRVVVVGDDELENEIAQVKDMDQSEQHPVPFGELEQMLQP
jgi:histidyl-tRNA synthetase